MRRDLAREFGFDQIVGESPAMKRMIALAYKVAESEASSVLLQGERDWQGPRRQGDPLRLAPRRQAVRRHQLRGDSLDADRERAVRL